MITQELRDLRNAPVAQVSFDDARTADALRDTCANCSNLAGPEPQAFSLRRDGKWPLRFSGQLVFFVTGQWEQEEALFDHRLAIFFDDSNCIIAGLTLCPRQNNMLRPTYWAQHVTDPNALERLLDQWCREILINGICPEQPDNIRDARSALHIMTAHALRVAKPHTERKEPCLQ